jgi:hypothetical protein
MSARFTVVPGGPSGSVFDSASAEDVFACVAPSAPGAKVLCTTELGLVCVRRRDPEPLLPDGRSRSLPQESWTERTVLLKPKVLLESVENLL